MKDLLEQLPVGDSSSVPLRYRRFPATYGVTSGPHQVNHSDSWETLSVAHSLSRSLSLCRSLSVAHSLALSLSLAQVGDSAGAQAARDKHA